MTKLSQFDSQSNIHIWKIKVKDICDHSQSVPKTFGQTSPNSILEEFFSI